MFYKQNFYFSKLVIFWINKDLKICTLEHEVADIINILQILTIILVIFSSALFKDRTFKNLAYNIC